MFQRALNANNGITGDPTEWDIAMLLADCFNSMAVSSWDQAIDAAVSQAPASEKFITDIKDLVQLHGGGAPDFCYIREQEAFYKVQGVSYRLGETFVKNIIKLKLDEYHPMSAIRHAVIACQLTAINEENGIAKLISDTAVRSLASKTKSAMIHKMQQRAGDRSHLFDKAA